MTRSAPLLAAALFAVAAAAVPAAPPGALVSLDRVPAREELIDSPMYHDPELPRPRLVSALPAGTVGLWVRALERPEAELRYRAADAVARARALGIGGLEEAVPALRRELGRAEQPPEVLVAVASALVALDDRGSAEALARRAGPGESGGGDAALRDVVEPALARWDYAPARAAWRARLADEGAPPRGVALALRGLAAVGDVEAVEPITSRLRSAATPWPLRLEAADALARLRDTGLTPEAEQLADPAGPVEARLAAAGLLARHRDGDAVRLLTRLAADPEPAVAARAARRLLEIDPALAAPLADGLLGRPDPVLRLLGTEVLRHRGGAGAVRTLAALLPDPHPDVRAAARRALEDLAGRPGLREAVIAAGAAHLGGESWRAQEQAAYLVARLGHRPAAAALLPLLDSPRPEVGLAAAWGLRRLAVPETYPAVIGRLEDTLKRLRAVVQGDTTVPARLVEFQAAQLAQLAGQQRIADAEPILREYVPRLEKPLSTPVGVEARAAAVWALGRLREGRTDAALGQALVERLSDVNSRPPENGRVRWMAALTLGRLGAKEATVTLRTFCPRQVASPDLVTTACGWALERLTGEKLEVPGEVRLTDADWFLVPVPAGEK